MGISKIAKGAAAFLAASIVAGPAMATPARVDVRVKSSPDVVRVVSKTRYVAAPRYYYDQYFGFPAGITLYLSGGRPFYWRGNDRVFVERRVVRNRDYDRGVVIRDRGDRVVIRDRGDRVVIRDRRDNDRRFIRDVRRDDRVVIRDGGRRGDRVILR